MKMVPIPLPWGGREGTGTVVQTPLPGSGGSGEGEQDLLASGVCLSPPSHCRPAGTTRKLSDAGHKFLTQLGGLGRVAGRHDGNCSARPPDNSP
jgi:hypothetical protein